MSGIIWTSTTQNTAKKLPRLPLAVAILVPARLASHQRAQLERALHSVPFAQSLWLGQAAAPITDFAEARNSVLSLIQEPWVLWLDSDEWFAEPTITVRQLQQILERAEKNQEFAFALRRIDRLHQQPIQFGETSAVTLARLHHKTAGSFAGMVHERFQPHNHRITMTTLTIQHEAHQDLSSFFKKICHYAELRATELMRKPRPPSHSLLIIQLLVWPLAKFCWNLFWLQGWRDGWLGLSYALMMSLHSAMVRIMALELSLVAAKKHHEN